MDNDAVTTNLTDRTTWPTNGFYADFHEERKKFARLRMCNPADGFLRANTNGIPGEYIWRRMKEAPVSGYTNELVLPMGHSEHYFYFKAGPYYGKAKSTVRLLISNGTVLETVVVMGLQTDGSRNLDGGDQ
jgi:hypothetical protein